MRPPTIIVYEGAPMRMKDAARLAGISYAALCARVCKGGDPQATFDAILSGAIVIQVRGSRRLGGRHEWKAPDSIEKLVVRKWLTACDCGDCHAGRAASRPRTDAERSARMGRELAARVAAHRGNQCATW